MTAFRGVGMQKTAGDTLIKRTETDFSHAPWALRIRKHLQVIEKDNDMRNTVENIIEGFARHVMEKKLPGRHLTVVR